MKFPKTKGNTNTPTLQTVQETTTSTENTEQNPKANTLSQFFDSHDCECVFYCREKKIIKKKMQKRNFSSLVKYLYCLLQKIKTGIFTQFSFQFGIQDYWKRSTFPCRPQYHVRPGQRHVVKIKYQLLEVATMKLSQRN